jgi:hypothetical protein
LVVKFVRKPQAWLTLEAEAEVPLEEVPGREGIEKNHRRKA